MKKALILFTICISSFFVIGYAADLYTWEDLKTNIWNSGDNLTAEDFNNIINRVIQNSDEINYNKFLSMFSVVIDKVMQIEKKFANIFSDESGNVGIGTQTPENTLDIAGTIGLDAEAANSLFYQRSRLITESGYASISISCDDENDIAISCNYHLHNSLSSTYFPRIVKNYNHYCAFHSDNWQNYGGGAQGGAIFVTCLRVK